MSSGNSEFGNNIKFSIKKKFGIIKLNRIHRGNALTTEMVKNLKKALEFCQNSEKIRGIILTGNGKSFTTGMDIDEIDGSDHEAVKEYEKTAAAIQEVCYYGKPIICAINGKAMGDGVAYTLCSDYRIAVKDCFFMMPEINLGVFPGTGIIVLMTRVIGIPWTKKILMFAEKISSEKALFYTGEQTIHRPIVHRCHKRLFNRYAPNNNTSIVFPEGGKPYSVYYSEQIKNIFKKNCNVNVLIDSHLGPIPLELDEMYPFAQSVFPERTDEKTAKTLTKILKGFIKEKDIIFWNGDKTLEELKPSKT